MQNMTYRPAARLRVNTKPPVVTLAFIALNVLVFVLDRGLGLIQYGSLDQGPLTVWGLRYNHCPGQPVVAAIDGGLPARLHQPPVF